MKIKRNILELLERSLIKLQNALDTFAWESIGSVLSRLHQEIEEQKSPLEQAVERVKRRNALKNWILDWKKPLQSNPVVGDVPLLKPSVVIEPSDELRSLLEMRMKRQAECDDALLRQHGIEPSKV